MSYSHSNLKNTHTHSNQWGKTNLSPRASANRSRKQHHGQGSHKPFARKSWSHRLKREQLGSSGADSLVADAKGSQRDMEQHSGARKSLSQQWSGICLGYTLESGVLHPSGSLDKCLGTPDDKWALSQKAYLWVLLLCRHGCSCHMYRQLKHAFLPDVSGVT